MTILILNVSFTHHVCGANNQENPKYFLSIDEASTTSECKTFTAAARNSHRLTRICRDFLTFDQDQWFLMDVFAIDSLLSLKLYMKNGGIITSNHCPFGCPMIYLDKKSQYIYYFIYRHLSNAWHNNVHSIMGVSCLTIIVSNVVVWFSPFNSI